MKISIPKLHSIKPKFSDDGAVRHLRERVIDLLASKENPVIGFALVTIHAPQPHKPLSHGYTADWHCSDTTVHHTDIPDLFKNKLTAEITSQEAIRLLDEGQ